MSLAQAARMLRPRRLLLLMVATTLFGCGRTATAIAEGTALSILLATTGVDDGECEIVPGKESKVRNCGPPTECVSKNGKGCFQIDDPEWKDAWNLSEPPAGSVRPPPSCAICSPLSSPNAPTRPARRATDLPKYLMSQSCLLDHLRTHDFVQWSFAPQGAP